MIQKDEADCYGAQPFDVTPLRSLLQHRLKVLFLMTPIESHVTKYVSHAGTLTLSSHVYMWVTKGE